MTVAVKRPNLERLVAELGVAETAAAFGISEERFLRWYAKNPQDDETLRFIDLEPVLFALKERLSSRDAIVWLRTPHVELDGVSPLREIAKTRSAVPYARTDPKRRDLVLDLATRARI